MITDESGLAYDSFRCLAGVPEGRLEFGSGTAVNLEYNAEELNGVHFEKGCYLGQELVARTHTQGVLRKRVLPVVAVPPNAPDELVFRDDDLFGTSSRSRYCICHSVSSITHFNFPVL